MWDKTLYIFVEGNDDEAFFQTIIKPEISSQYENIKIIPYANKKKEFVEKFAKSILSMKADYIYTTDNDNKPCITSKKEAVLKKKQYLEDRLFIVVEEIESWYLAGLGDTARKKLNISSSKFKEKATDKLTKEQFMSLMPKKFDSKIDFLMEILKNFSIPTAKKRNKSFKYFYEKHCN